MRNISNMKQFLIDAIKKMEGGEQLINIKVTKATLIAIA